LNLEITLWKKQFSSKKKQSKDHFTTTRPIIAITTSLIILLSLKLLLETVKFYWRFLCSKNEKNETKENNLSGRF